MRHWIQAAAFVVLSGFVYGCPDPPPAPPPPALAGCGTLGATITGTGVNPLTGSMSEISTTATIVNASGTGITWTNGGAGSDTDPISGTNGTGTVTPVPGSTPPGFTVSITTTVGGNTLTITGTITVNTPPPCTGSGTWTAKNDAGYTVGSGAWTIP